jgi:hypothetical protein
VQLIQDGVRFQCRIGHAYGEAELIAAKERALEHDLWATTTLIEEYADMLEDLVRVGGKDRRLYLLRIQKLRALAMTLRQLIESDIVISLPEQDKEP